MGGAQVATVGRFEVQPDLVNVVPQRRHAHRRPAQHRRRRCCSEAERRLADEVDRLAARRGRDASRRRSLARFEPVDFDPATIDLVEATAQRLGHSTRRMPSGAGHDAQMLARICPTAMIFTPERRTACRTTSPSTPTRTTSTAGADVLLQTLLALAD